jgi:hypothetical protein
MPAKLLSWLRAHVPHRNWNELPPGVTDDLSKPVLLRASTTHRYRLSNRSRYKEPQFDTL